MIFAIKYAANPVKNYAILLWSLCRWVIGTSGSGDCLIPNIISPNNDGANDFFIVSCIDFFPNNRLRIFNRWGDKVLDVKNYQNDWAGTFRNELLPPGTYFYLLQLGGKRRTHSRVYYLI